MGVIDDGVVHGIMLNPFQQHHIILNIKDTLERYSPPVPDHLYQIKFVPIVEPGLFYTLEHVHAYLNFL